MKSIPNGRDENRRDALRRRRNSSVHSKKQVLRESREQSSCLSCSSSRKWWDIPVADQVLTAQTGQNTVGTPQVQFLDKVVDMPVVVTCPLLCNGKCRWCRQCRSPWPSLIQVLFFRERVVDIPLVPQRAVDPVVLTLHVQLLN